MSDNTRSNYLGLKVAYIIATYPNESEGFIRRELEEVCKHGVAVYIYALRRGGGDRAKSCSNVLYRDKISITERLLSLLLAMKQPTALLKRLFHIVRYTWRSPMELFVSLRNFPTAAAFARRIRRTDATHIHAHFAGEPLRFAETIAALTALPFSFSVHARDIFVGKPAITATIKNATGAAVCTQAALERMEEVLPETLHAKVHLVRHGIRACPPPPAEHTDSVLFAGRLVEKKGVPVLLDAIQILHERGRKLRCIIAGDGPLRNDIEQKIRKLNFRDCIEMAGWVSYEKICGLMTTCLALAVPSVVAEDGDRDGLPNVILEAAMRDLPVVASDAGGINEFIIDLETGLLVRAGNATALADALERMALDSELRRKLAINAREKAKRDYDASINSARLIEVLKWKK